MFAFDCDRYAFTIDRRGLFQLSTAWGGVLLDRGGMHEWLDIHSGARTIREQWQRDLVHWLQIGPAIIEQQTEREVVVSGLLSCSGRLGGMSFRSHFVCYQRAILMRVHRRYTIGCNRVADDSLCFLAPPKRTQTFHCRVDGRYLTRVAVGVWGEYSPDIIPVATPVTDPKGGRVTKRGWAGMFGEGGVGVIVCEYSPGMDGLWRCTRPPILPEKKFDEVEFQWQLDGPRTRGQVQTGTFLIVPAKRADDVDELFREIGERGGQDFDRLG